MVCERGSQLLGLPLNSLTKTCVTQQGRDRPCPCIIFCFDCAGFCLHVTMVIIWDVAVAFWSELMRGFEMLGGMWRWET